MVPDILTAIYNMTKRKKNKEPDVESLKKDISEAREKTPEHVDWTLCAETVDSLHVWIDELCTENHKLKQLLQNVIEKLKEDNAQTKKILQGLEPRFKKFDGGSTDNEDL